jgi:hypothetical protein
MGGSSKNPPDAPRYEEGAERQAASSKDVTNAQTYANRPTINTPWGKQSWETGTAVDPVTGKPYTSWEMNLSLSPEEQASLDSQQRVTMGKSQAAETLVDQATGAFKKEFDWAGQPEVPGSLGEAQGSAYDKMSAMLEPRRGRTREALETRLANQGLARGTEAFKNAQRDQSELFDQQDRGLLAAAMGEGRSDVATQQQMRQAGIAEEAQRRGMSLNELNALLTGQQVNMPTMPSFNQAGSSQAEQALAAATERGTFELGRNKQKQDAQPDIGSAVGAVASLAGAAAAFY